jgi:hypothetical protein
MRKTLLFTAVMLLGTALMFAQDTNSSSSSSQNGANSSSQSGSTASEGQSGTTTTTQQTTTTTEQTTGKNSVQGCLTGSTGNYTLTNAMGVTYQLQGDDSELSANVNKEVDVIGTPSSTAWASASNSPTAGSNAGSATTPQANNESAHASASSTKTMQVTSVQKIADTCSTGNQAAPQQ